MPNVDWKMMLLFAKAANAADWYYGQSLPTGRTPSNSQISKMEDNWTEADVT